jgi:GntR family transcriptional regulator
MPMDVRQRFVSRPSTHAGPAYQRIADHLQARIETGEIEAGSMLPPERTLCQEYAVSRMTLRQACGLLEQEGLIERRRGSGTFVSPKKMRKRQQEMRGFTEEIRARGGNPSSRLLAFRTIDPELATRDFLALPVGALVYQIERLRLNDGVPLALENVEVPCHLCPNLDRFDLATQSLYAILEENYGLTLSHCFEEISAARSTPRLRRMLALPASTPVLAIQRRTFTTNHTPVELASTIYRGDLYSAMVRSVRAR